MTTTRTRPAKAKAQPRRPWLSGFCNPRNDTASHCRCPGNNGGHSPSVGWQPCSCTCHQDMSTAAVFAAPLEFRPPSCTVCGIEVAGDGTSWWCEGCGTTWDRDGSNGVLA